MATDTDNIEKKSGIRALGPVAFVVEGRRAAVGRIAVTAFLAGMAEALFLVTITRAAVAVSGGKDRVGIIAGHYLSVSQTLAVAAGLVAVRLLLASASIWQSTVLTTKLTADLRRRLGAAFLRASWSIQQGERTGSLQELLTTYMGGATGVINGVVNLVLSGANLLALLSLAVVVDPSGAAILLVCVLVLSSLVRPLRSAVRRRGRAVAQVGMEFATSLNEVSQLGLELHVFQVQGTANERIVTLIEKTRDKNQRLGFFSGLVNPLYSAMAYAALIGAMAVVYISGSASLASLGAVMLVMMRSLGYGQSLQSAYLAVAASTPYVEGLQERLAYFEGGRRHDGGRPIGSVSVLAADHISFSYTPGESVLDDISFSIARHEIIGIVGPSGGGKSTLVQLVLGLRDPDAGRILADDRDVGELAKDEWARKVTFVPQSAHLVAGTIADNIRFLRPGISDSDVERAASLAHVHDDITGFPEGYLRQVGEQGGHLSGGQQQRLCIARALVENPDVLILDEPTSALDVRSEHLVRTTLLSLKERMTVIVIAHRLSTLDICDRIMVIESGRLRGFDTPARLEETNDFYREALVLSGMR